MYKEKEKKINKIDEIGERGRKKEKQRGREKRGKTHPLYCISDFVTRVSSAAIPDRYSLSFNDRIYVCVYANVSRENP